MSRSSNSTEPRAADLREGRAGTILLLLLCGGFLCLVAALRLGGETLRSVYFLPAAFVALTACCLPLRGTWRLNMAVLLLFLAPIPWICEACVGWLADAQRTRDLAARRDYAAKSGWRFDERSHAQLVRDLRSQGQDAWPQSHPAVLLLNNGGEAHSVLKGSDGRELQALAGISGVVTEFGNEDGRFAIYHADEHGFRNPAGVWPLPRLDLAFVGDSFTEGSSVPDGSHFVDVTRRRWPATLNLGYGGNGPLIELASLLEYLPQRRPRVVVWALCETNDLGEDLEREMASPLLMRYWREARNLQHLEERQQEIDHALRGYVDKVFQSALAPAKPARMIPFLSLLGLRTASYELSHVPENHWDVFTDVLRTARDTVGGWNGQLVLVYLPVALAKTENWAVRRKHGPPEDRRRRALDIGATLGIPVIDVGAAFQQAGAGAQRFVYPYGGHFTTAGYEAAGAAIVRGLEAGKPGGLE